MGKRLASIVLGATGIVGSSIVEHLSCSGGPVVAVSRTTKRATDVTWMVADLTSPELKFPQSETVYCATDVRISAKAIAGLLQCHPKRMIVFSTTSVISKIDSKDDAERSAMENTAEAEQTIIRACEKAKIEWTILRPTLIYLEGRDKNITRIADLIRKIGFMPLYGSASGLRQPVHAEDLALGAIAAAKSTNAANSIYSTSGFDTFSYREMVGRIFDGLGRRRILVNLPPPLWRSALALARPFYPAVTPMMGERMLKDLVFDSSAAVSDFGWNARGFAPFKS